MTTTAVQVYQRIADPAAFIRDLGKSIAISGMFGAKSIEQGQIFALECMAKGMPPLSIAERYHIIFDKLSMKADAMLADFRTKIGGTHKLIERSPEAAEIELINGKEKHRFRLTWADAQGEPFVYDGKESVVLSALAKGDKPAIKAKYQTPRARTQMLWARVVSDGVRAMAPEIVAGYYTPEEIGDDPNVIDVSAGPVQQHTPDDVDALMRQAAASQQQPEQQQPEQQQPEQSSTAGPTLNVTSRSGEVIDAEYEITSNVTPEPAAASSALSQSAAPQPAFDPQQQTTLERISPAGLQMLQSQVKNAMAAGLSKDQARQRIEHYAGGEGRKMADLTPDAAVEFTKELAAFLRERKAGVGASAGVDEGGLKTQSPAPAVSQQQSSSPAAASGTNGHITETQVLQIRTIVADLAKIEPDIEAKLTAIIRGGGKSRLEDCSKEAGEMILERLYAKARAHEESKRRTSQSETAGKN